MFLNIWSLITFARDVILAFLSFVIEFLDRPIQSIFGDNLSTLREPYWLPKEEGNAVITGGTTGLGKETARALARVGYRVIITGPDEEQGKQAAIEIRDETGNPNVEYFVVDHASLASVRTFAEKLIDRDLPIHILMNNAGGMYRERIVTGDGMEKTFQVNYVAHFLLTHLLLENVKKANPPGRIINVSSFMHWFGRIRFGDLTAKKWYLPSLAYCDTKLAMLLFTKELQKKLASEGRKDILVVAVHPGSVDTAIKEGYPEYMRIVSSLLFKTANWGARTHIYSALASPRELIPGQYYVDTAPLWVSSRAKDPKLALRLWMETEKLVKSSE